MLEEEMFNLSFRNLMYLVLVACKIAESGIVMNKLYREVKSRK